MATERRREFTQLSDWLRKVKAETETLSRSTQQEGAKPSFEDQVATLTTSTLTIRQQSTEGKARLDMFNEFCPADARQYAVAVRSAVVAATWAGGVHLIEKLLVDDNGAPQLQGALVDAIDPGPRPGKMEGEPDCEAQMQQQWSRAVRETAQWEHEFVLLYSDGTIPAIAAGKSSEQPASSLQCASGICERMSRVFESFMNCRSEIAAPLDAWQDPRASSLSADMDSFLPKLATFVQCLRTSIMPACSDVLLRTLEAPAQTLLAACKVADDGITSVEKAIDAPEGHAPDLAEVLGRYGTLKVNVAGAVERVKDVSLGDIDGGRMFFLQRHNLVVSAAVDTLSNIEAGNVAKLKVTGCVADTFLKFKAQLDTYTAWLTSSSASKYEAQEGRGKDMDIQRRSSAAVKALTKMEQKILALFDQRASELADVIYKYAPPSSLLDNFRLIGDEALQKNLAKLPA
ncbi:unnamed protein product [Prorocentrum cordatum]|uniref:Uncharacterized protein n=1 Tax=Prorocentrum cordatum TaxID=2364126 RepID=A0ABN9T0P6_9DINO|nr:unnamed protein product [Polarella glacialis]